MGNIGEPRREVEAPEPVPEYVPEQTPETTPAEPVKEPAGMTCSWNFYDAGWWARP